MCRTSKNLIQSGVGTLPVARHPERVPLREGSRSLKHRMI